jgi:DNA-binding response OmpR family regulator
MPPRILVVDDDDLVSGLVARHLTAHGFEVSVASTPAAAMATIEWLRPRCVLVDIELGPYDGAALLGALRRVDDAAAYVLMSASDGRATAERLGVPFVAKGEGFLQRVAGIVPDAS